ncbi:alpha/beta fold hydrolase [Pokkaliibacter sp. MBI-7]|uniref:alpha/beta hydrolase family protein n=1 Tax=Pokkaliibacter sp. MBI-7 TaxID=3040600 RepID=UPI00244C951E|nr:alpha/beta fold hydrolase [Pokkaliibacter sp. MBI-7]MDH2433033.1 alpha/beta fold hydrolase [Pokkaliibacter sp. MBI-7]
MWLFYLFIALGSALLSPLAAADTAPPIGFRQIVIGGDDGQPGRQAVLLYPAQADATQTPALIADNPAFIGIHVLPEATIAAGRHPLVVLSHGYGGNWRNQLWLAQALAQAGYLVLAANHPGTTSGDITPATGGQLWQRPLDIRRAIDWVSIHLAAEFDADRVAVIGHSLGGWTAMMAAGARFSPAQMQADCVQHPTDVSCKAYGYLTRGQPEATFTQLAADWRDPRIKAAVTLDLGLARGLTVSSLEQMPVPVLVLAADPRSRQVPALLESGYLASHLPAERLQYQVIDGASHFSFIQRCKAGAAALLEAYSPGDGMICADEGERPREAIQQQVAALILTFLQRTLD